MALEDGVVILGNHRGPEQVRLGGQLVQREAGGGAGGLCSAGWGGGGGTVLPAGGWHLGLMVGVVS